MKDYPLVLIHGYPFDRTMWFSTIASLGANAKVIAPDLPGFGKTPLPAGEAPSLEFMADFIAHLIGENHAEKAVLAGMSMGGYVALAFAERHADRLAGLGLVSPQAGADTPETRKARKEMIEKIRTGGPSVAVDALLPKMFAAEEPEIRSLKNTLNAPRRRPVLTGFAGHWRRWRKGPIERLWSKTLLYRCWLLMERMTELFRLRRHGSSRNLARIRFSWKSPARDTRRRWKGPTRWRRDWAD